MPSSQPENSPTAFNICSKGSQVWSRTDVLALNGSLGGTEPQADILVPPTLLPIRQLANFFGFHPRDSLFFSGTTHATLSRTLGLALGNQRDVGLLLESTLRLHSQFGSHLLGCS